MAGVITFTGVGTFDVSGGNLKVAMDACTTGGATASADTSSYVFIPTANGMRVTVFRMARGA